MSGSDSVRGALERLRDRDPAQWTGLATALPGPWRPVVERLRAGPDAAAALVRALSLPDALLGERPLPAAAVDLLHQGSYPARLMSVMPDAVPDLASETFGEVTAAGVTAELLTSIAEFGPATGLGRARTRAYLQLCRAELLCAPLEVVAGGLSALAIGCVAAALEACGLSDNVCAFGMGKLGGHELNFLSDIDLIFVHDDALSGDDEGTRRSRLAMHDQLRNAVRLLEGEGAFRPLFRVDLRLRPFGTRGPLSLSCAGTESYYERHGRGWERQAWLRARPIAGRLDLGHALMLRLEPFVFRRTVTAAIFGEIDELMQRARRDAQRSAFGQAIDLKFDEGGIREVEFSVQALQLLHGGHNAAVRGQGTIPALDGLLAAGLVSDREHRALVGAYRFLRRVEHRVQLAEGQQTHRVPAGPSELATLAARLAVNTDHGDAEPDAFLRELQRHRGNVETIAATISASGKPTEPNDGGTSEAAANRRAVLDFGAPAAVRLAALAALGVRDPEEADAVLRHLASRPDGAFAAGGAALRGAQRLLEACLDSADPDRALDRLAEFAALRPAHYGAWRLLADDNERTAELVRLTAELFGTSDLLSRGLIGFPVGDGRLREENIALLLEADTSVLPGPGEHTAVAEQTEIDPRGLDPTLLRLKHRQLVSIALHDLGQRPDPLAVGRSLSDLADLLLRQLLRDVVAEAAADDPNAHGLRLGVFALGKYGMQAMDYGSDLDLLFVYDTEVDLRERPAAQTIAIKLGQRIVARLEDRRLGLRLYEVDMRLRPSGRQGLLVSPLAAFARYHARPLPVWERLALLRMRPVAEATVVPGHCRPGDDDPTRSSAVGSAVAAALCGPLCAEVSAIVRRTLIARPPNEGPLEIARDTTSLVERLAHETARESRNPPTFNAKSGRGACLELEFLVGALCLTHAQSSPELLVADVIGALELLATGGIIDPEEGRALCAAYRFVRLLLNRLRMTHARGFDDPDRFSQNSPRLRALARRMGMPNRDALLLRYEASTQLVREAFTRYLGA